MTTRRGPASRTCEGRAADRPPRNTPRQRRRGRNEPTRQKRSACSGVITFRRRRPTIVLTSGGVQEPNPGLHRGPTLQQGAPFPFRHPTPDAVLDPSVQSVCQALGLHGTAGAQSLRLILRSPFDKEIIRVHRPARSRHHPALVHIPPPWPRTASGVGGADRAGTLRRHVPRVYGSVPASLYRVTRTPARSQGPTASGHQRGGGGAPGSPPPTAAPLAEPRNLSVQLSMAIRMPRMSSTPPDTCSRRLRTRAREMTFLRRPTNHTYTP